MKELYSIKTNCRGVRNRIEEDLARLEHEWNCVTTWHGANVNTFTSVYNTRLDPEEPQDMWIILRYSAELVAFDDEWNVT